MATVSRSLPASPSLDIPRRQARELLKALHGAEPEALARVRGRHPRYKQADDALLAATRFKLSDAQLVLASEYGFPSWAAMKRRIELHPQAHELERAIRGRDGVEVARLLRESPALLHIPLRSGNWGPPMSHAANFGFLDMIQLIASLGAKDFQHAFDRALLQGRIESARWLHGQGAQLSPGIIMGSCETLNREGFGFLAELGASLTDERGDRLAPLALVLETYARNPVGKHAILDLFESRGIELPDTPMMAFHRGDVGRLGEHLRRDPSLVHRRFPLKDIYPPEVGCGDDGRRGMHGTPLDGTTMLHLAIDFDEREVFDLLLARGADVNAGAMVDTEGFGGHTPLFVALVNSAVSNGLQRDGSMARALLERGASADVRVNLRKFLDWQDVPGWHVAHDVSPLGWARGFPIQRWVNGEALRMVEGG